MYKEIYYKESVHVNMAVEKFDNLLFASWRPRMNNGPLESEGLRIRRTNGENSSPRLKVRKPEE